VQQSILKFNCIVNIITGNELRAIRATRDHVLTALPRTLPGGAQRIPTMLYLKNTLSSLSRSLHDSAVQSFQGPYRWWKLALYLVMFVLPGGSLGVLFFAWIDHRRNGHAAQPAKHSTKQSAGLPSLTGAHPCRNGT
jgi:hypothetical protein